MITSKLFKIGTITVFIFFLLGACQTTDPPTVEVPEILSAPIEFDLDKIKKSGKLKALVENNSTSYFTYKGRLMGFEYEMLKLLCKEIDVDLEIIVVRDIAEAFEMLNKGEGDIIALSLTVTQERKKHIAFTERLYTTRQVLVQRKPENWAKMRKSAVLKSLVRNQVELIGKEIVVRKNSSYGERLRNLEKEIGGDIDIIEEDGDLETEAIIKKVATGAYDYTVADESQAQVNALYYPILDIETPLSFPQQISWGVRTNSNEFLAFLNNWIVKRRESALFHILYNKYYKSQRSLISRAQSNLTSFNGTKISDYDALIKEQANAIEWDWRLLASQIYQESRFNPSARSWAGAIGIMQLMPASGKKFGAKDLYNPEQNIVAGCKYLVHLDKLWAKTIEDKEERIKFILASYNVGLGHVIDARNLAKKHGKSTVAWEDNVAPYLLLKSKPEYYKDPIVKSGYCRGEEPIKYVKEIFERFNQYKQLYE